MVGTHIRREGTKKFVTKGAYEDQPNSLWGLSGPVQHGDLAARNSKPKGAHAPWKGKKKKEGEKRASSWREWGKKNTRFRGTVCKYLVLKNKDGWAQLGE